MKRITNDTISGLPVFSQVDYNGSRVITASSSTSYKEMYGTGVIDPIKSIKLHTPIYLNIR